MNKCVSREDFERIGIVEFRRSARARRLSIYLSPHQPVKVILPWHIPFETAYQFVMKKQAWIQRHQVKLHSLKAADTYKGDYPLVTRNYQVNLIPATSMPIRIALENNVISIYQPSEMAITHPDIQAALKMGLVAAWRREAHQHLPERVTKFAQLGGFRYKNVFIKNLKSRWGSCSTHLNINLNLHLMRLPDELIDYVIWHELVHTQIPYHGAQFWNELQRWDRNVTGKRHIFRELARAGFLANVFMTYEQFWHRCTLKE